MKYRINITTAMASLFCYFMLFSTSTSAQSIKLEEGTLVRLRIQQEVSSATAQLGQTVTFEVLDDVKVGNTTVIAEGAAAQGTIVQVETKRSLGRAGKLAFQIEHVKAVDGTKIPLRATSINKGAGKSGTTGALVAGTAFVFLPAAPLFLLIKGKDITIPRGQHIDAFVDGNRAIQIREESDDFSPTTATFSTPTTLVSSGARAAIVNIITDVGSGEIEVDGVYYGNAPTSVKLTPGPHTIVVKRAGYKNWVRSLNLALGNITLRVGAERK